MSLGPGKPRLPHGVTDAATAGSHNWATGGSSPLWPLPLPSSQAPPCTIWGTSQSVFYFSSLLSIISPQCDLEPLHVTLTPKKLKTGIGSTVILSCTLMGSPEFTIRWYRNTELVLPDEAISIRGLGNETLLIASAQKSHSGAYQCFATRKSQTAQDFAIIMLEGEFWPERGDGGCRCGRGRRQRSGRRRPCDP